MRVPSACCLSPQHTHSTPPTPTPAAGLPCLPEGPSCPGGVATPSKSWAAQAPRGTITSPTSIPPRMQIAAKSSWPSGATG